MVGALSQDTQYPWIWLLLGIGLAIAGAWVQITKLGAMNEAIQKTPYKNPGVATTV